jgi:tetratricopeptide (TPR) repeat protein/RecA/RadA recombinase
MELSRVLEVVCDRGTNVRERWSVGSGYLVSERVVLTAAHVVTGAESIWVRFGGQREFPAASLLVTPGEVDLALLETTDGPAAERPTPCGTVARDVPGQIGECRAVGFPQFKELRSEGGRRLRDSVQVDGYIPIAEGLISGFLTLRAMMLPRAQTGESEWAGMSGAAVFARDTLVGVVTEHHLAEGEGSLTVTPFDRLHLVDGQTRDRFWRSLSVSVSPGSPLPVLRPAESGASGAQARKAGVSRLTLPDRLADFIGRGGELERIVGLLADAGGAAKRTTVMIWGQPGVGKSQLAVHAAHELLAGRTAAFYIDLQGYSSRRLTAETAAVQLLGAISPDQDPPADPGAQLAACREAMRAGRYVVVLDNAGTAAQVRPLLPGRCQTIVLITSRSALPTLDGELIPLDILPTGQAAQLIRLMAEREDDGPAEDDLEELVALCGNLPLALRIAGALLRGRPDWTVKHLNRRLRDETRRLSLLQRDDLAVHTVFESGFTELTDGERRLFALLGSMRATRLAPWMAAALLDAEAEDAEEILERLVDTQMLLTAGSDLGGEPRYRFHDLVRLFAREKLRELDADDVSRAELRVLSGYLRLALAVTHGHPLDMNYAVAKSVDTPWGPPPSAVPDLGDPMEWLIEERNDIVAEVQHAHEAGHWPYAWGLANILDPVFILSSQGPQSHQVKELALSAARAAGDVQAEMDARYAFVGLFLNENEHGKAIDELLRLRTSYLESGNLFKAAHMDESLGVVQRDWGQLKVAEDSLNRSIEGYALLNAASPVQPGVDAGALHNLAIVYREEGRLREAEELLGRCMAIFEDFDDTIAFGRTLHTRGVLHAYIGDYPAAETMFRRGNTMCRAVGDRRWTGITLLGLARLAGRREQWAQMHGLLDECAELFGSIPEPHGAAQVLRSRGSAFRRMGQLEDADQTLAQAHDALAELGDRRSHGRIHYSRALLQIDRHGWDRALEELASAGELLTEDDDAPWRGRVRLTTLRAVAHDQELRPYLADELESVRTDLDRFAALAGDGFTPTWITVARRRFGIQGP